MDTCVCMDDLLCCAPETWGFPGGTSSKKPACQCTRCKRRGFSPWVRRIPWRRAWQPAPIFLPGECHGQRSLVEFTAWHRELNLVLCDNLEEWDGVESGREVQEWGNICTPITDYIDVWQKTGKHCKAIILQLKIKINLKKLTLQISTVENLEEKIHKRILKNSLIITKEMH